MALDPSGPPVMRPYLRVSYDRSGRVRSNSEQLADHERDADRHGWTLGEPYEDVGSASRYATKTREGFSRLLADLTAGTFGGGILSLWEGSRGSRRMTEWAALVDLLEERQVKVWIVTHSRLYDPTNARDRRSLFEDAVDASYESDKTSARVRRTVASEAAAGRPHGITPFGYRRVYAERTGALVSQDPYEPEAAFVREVFERFLAGHSMRAITLDFEERGVRNASGNPYNQGHLRAWLANPAYGGFRIHAPGRKGARVLDGTEAMYKAAWPPLVSPDSWQETQRKLRDPARTTRRPGSARHLMSGTLRCGICGSKMTANQAPSKAGTKRQVYRCARRGCLQLDYEATDKLCADTVLGYLGRDDVHAELKQPDEQASEELRQAEADLSAARVELDRFMALADLGQLGALEARASAGTERRVQELEAKVRDLRTPQGVRSLPIAPGEDVARRWKDAPISARRETARVLFSPTLLGELRVLRAPAPGHLTEVHERLHRHQAGCKDCPAPFDGD